MLPKITDALNRGQEAYTTCQNSSPQELIAALEKHANKEGVDCLESTLKYQNEIQELIQEFQEGKFDFSKFLGELKEFYDNLPTYMDNCQKMEFHFWLIYLLVILSLVVYDI